MAGRNGEDDGVEGWIFFTLRQAQGDTVGLVATVRFAQFDTGNRGGEVDGVEFGGRRLGEMRERNEGETETRRFGVVEKCGA